MEEYQIKKIYYSMAEVSDLLQTKEYVIRFWLREFKIKVHRAARTNHRQFVVSDINNLSEIKRLLKVDGFTINGAKKRFADFQPNTQELVII